MVFPYKDIVSKAIVVVITSLWLLSLSTEAAAPEYLYHICGSNTTIYYPNSTFKSNLNLLLSNLSSNNTPNNLFYNTTGGSGPPGAAYGLFLCRGDVTINVCHDCVLNASQEIIQRCPKEKVAYIWYDQCMLRYDNRSFFGTMDESPKVYMWNMQNITEPDRFAQLLGDTMDKLANRASSDRSLNDQYVNRFATEDVNFTRLQRLYSLVQCTPDLSATDCNRCLRVAIGDLPNCCNGKKGGRVLQPSCNIRYETYPFYEIKATAPSPSPTPPPAPPLPISSTNPRGKGKLSSEIIIAIVVPVGLSLVLLAIGFCLLSRKRRRKYNVVEEENVGDEITILQSLQFDLSTIEVATNNFSSDNKIGEGGFGLVYKGILADGQEIAVKRLSKTSSQGAAEFNNEVVLVAKLQHRNLVRLLGFCREGGETMLIYEYVPNHSLDWFLFG
ncbi:unnamed protein product [Ilex paraguariensis]|uniref:Cysteine-rich receptor-like protein kinase 25 n=1 Tax=Ilex paraguariensis TaxID=185542 RepID=A0ABC8UGZ1_9AQUA